MLFKIKLIKKNIKFLLFILFYYTSNAVKSAKSSLHGPIADKKKRVHLHNTQIHSKSSWHGENQIVSTCQRTNTEYANSSTGRCCVTHCHQASTNWAILIRKQHREKRYGRNRDGLKTGTSMQFNFHGCIDQQKVLFLHWLALAKILFDLEKKKHNV